MEHQLFKELSERLHLSGETTHQNERELKLYCYFLAAGLL